MQPHDERAQTLLGEVLHLVQGEQHPDLALPSQFTQLGKQVGEVAVEASRISPSRGGVYLSDHIAAVGKLPPQLERLEHAERAASPIGNALSGRKAQDGIASQQAHRAREVEVFRSLDVLVDPPSCLGDLAQFLQQHGLAHAAQPGQQQATVVAAQAQPLDGDVKRAEFFVSAHQCRGLGTGAGVVGVADRIDEGSLYGFRGVYMGSSYKGRETP